ncbi:hypothetical protein Vadar_018196 [Vaccinium darrowii]|uniref:Uncharacterized protein n=1 Tax=Vaccinium darrowii TaxID=229202 RepID=A0ACB7Z5H0_9ERIC|nr:hypothetical protein Vadar_018196 [Vaccinium darrowii]
MKSRLLLRINEIDGRFRNMVLLVKEWAKAHGINDSKSGTLNSYCLRLLIIFHFQTCVLALLPPLKEIYPGNMVDDLTGVRAVAERHNEEVCAENVMKFKSDKSRNRNQSSLSELTVSFLAKFSDISLRAVEERICLYTGQWEPIDSNMRWLPKTYALFVEDPFEKPANCARTVSSQQLVRISEVFQATHHMLISGHQNQHSLIAMLVRPQLSQFFARTPGNPSSYHGGYSVTPRPQMQRVTTLPDAHFVINDLRLEYVIVVEGVVWSRPSESVNKKRKTGMIEVAAEHVQVLNAVRSKLLFLVTISDMELMKNKFVMLPREDALLDGSVVA